MSHTLLNSAQINPRILKDLKLRIAAEAQRQGKSLSALAREALERYAQSLPPVAIPRFERD